MEETEEDSVSAESAESEESAEEADPPEDTATAKKPTSTQDTGTAAGDSYDGEFDAEDDTNEEVENIDDDEVDDGVEDEIGDDVIESDQEMRVEEVCDLISPTALVAHPMRTCIYSPMCIAACVDRTNSSHLAGHIGARCV